MVLFNDMASQFIRSANVGNLVSVRMSGITVIIKPSGATMV